MLSFSVSIERNGRVSKYGDFRIQSADPVFIILQINNIKTLNRNDMRIYVNCKPGQRTYLEPGLGELSTRIQSNVQVSYAEICVVYKHVLSFGFHLMGFGNGQQGVQSRHRNVSSQKNSCQSFSFGG